MKRTVKFVSICLSMLFVLTVMASVGVSAGSTGSIDESLVIHYDFKGSDETTALKDKAPKGTVNDDLSFSSSADDKGISFDLTNGSVTSSSDNSGLLAPLSNDVKLAGDDATFFVRAKVFGTTQGTYNIFSLNSKRGRTANILYTLNSGSKSFGTSRLKTVGGSLNKAFTTDYTGEYINFAMVHEKTEAGVNISIYTSYGLPTDKTSWSLAIATYEAANYAPADANWDLLRLFVAVDNSGNNLGNCGITIDDFRLYNDALTLDEVATIIPNGSFDQTTGAEAKPEIPEDVPNTPITEANLIMHYDFEGETLSDALKDKATGGIADDNLGMYNSSVLHTGAAGETGIVFDKTNGTVLSTTQGYGLGAEVSADTEQISAQSSWFVRAKMQDFDSQQYYSLIDMATNRPFRLLYDKVNKQIVIGVGTVADIRNNKKINYDYDFTKNEYINIAVTIDEFVEGTTLKVKVNAYVCTGMPEDKEAWGEPVLKDWTFNAPRGEVKDYVHILHYSDHNSATGLTLDDVRLYNGVLTLDDIVSIIATGSFDKGAAAQYPPINNSSENQENTDTETAEEPATTPESESDSETAEEKGGCSAVLKYSEFSIVMLLLMWTLATIKNKKYKNKN